MIVIVITGREFRKDEIPMRKIIVKLSPLAQRLFSQYDDPEQDISAILENLLPINGLGKDDVVRCDFSIGEGYIRRG